MPAPCQTLKDKIFLSRFDGTHTTRRAQRRICLAKTVFACSRDPRHRDYPSGHGNKNDRTLKAIHFFHSTPALVWRDQDMHPACALFVTQQRARHSSDETSHASRINCIATISTHTYTARRGLVWSARVADPRSTGSCVEFAFRDTCRLRC